MALNAKLSNLAATAKIDAETALLDGGSIELYNGAQPASADTPVTTQTLLVSCALPSPAYDPGVNGVAQQAAPAQGVAVASDTATWYRMKTAGGAVVEDGTVGQSGANLNLTATFIIAGATIVIDAFVLTQRKSL